MAAAGPPFVLDGGGRLRVAPVFEARQIGAYFEDELFSFFPRPSPMLNVRVTRPGRLLSLFLPAFWVTSRAGPEMSRLPLVPTGAEGSPRLAEGVRRPPPALTPLTQPLHPLRGPCWVDDEEAGRPPGSAQAPACAWSIALSDRRGSGWLALGGFTQSQTQTHHTNPRCAARARATEPFSAQGHPPRRTSRGENHRGSRLEAPGGSRSAPHWLLRS